MSALLEFSQAQKNPSLLVRPAPRYLEGPQGYLLRLAETNCLKASELRKLDPVFDMHWLTAHRLLAEVPAESNWYRYLEIVVESKKMLIWNDKFRRFCPLCLEEQPIWQIGWELLFHDVCPRHGVWLIDQCSSCGHWIKPNRDNLEKCQCESDLRNEVARAAPDNSRRLSALLVEKLLGLVPEEPYPEVFQSLDVEKLQRLIRFLGTHLDPAAGRRPLKIHSVGKMQVSWPVTSRAAEILFRWPAAFHHVLDQMQGSESEEKKSFVRLFRQTYQYLYKNLQDSSFQPVRTAFENWVGESWKGSVAKRNHRMPSCVVGNPAWISGSVAATDFGVSISRLRHMVQTGQVEGEETVSSSGRRFLMVKRQAGLSVSEWLATKMNRREVMESLCLGKKRTYKLLQHLFPTAIHANDNPHMPWCIPREEVEALVAIGEELQVCDQIEFQQVTLGHLLRYWNWEVEEIAELIQAAQTATLKPLAILKSFGGISGWIFNMDELRDWRISRNQYLAEWFTVEESANMLTTRPEVVRWLIGNGALEARRIPSLRRRGSRIYREELERFKDSYVFAVDIAKQLGMKSRDLKALLGGHGIYPLGSDAGKQCRQLVYHRNQRLVEVIRSTQQLRMDAGIGGADVEA